MNRTLDLLCPRQPDCHFPKARKSKGPCGFTRGAWKILISEIPVTGHRAQCAAALYLQRYSLLVSLFRNGFFVSLKIVYLRSVCTRWWWVVKKKIQVSFGTSVRGRTRNRAFGRRYRHRPVAGARLVPVPGYDPGLISEHGLEPCASAFRQTGILVREEGFEPSRC